MRKDENSTKSATEKTHVDPETGQDGCEDSRTKTGSSWEDVVQFVLTTTVAVFLRQIKRIGAEWGDEVGEGLALGRQWLTLS